MDDMPIVEHPQLIECKQCGENTARLTGSDISHLPEKDWYLIVKNYLCDRPICCCFFVIKDEWYDWKWQEEEK